MRNKILSEQHNNNTEPAICNGGIERARECNRIPTSHRSTVENRNTNKIWRIYEKNLRFFMNTSIPNKYTTKNSSKLRKQVKQAACKIASADSFQ